MSNTKNSTPEDDLPTEIPSDPEATQDPSGARFAVSPGSVVFLEADQPYVPHDPYAPADKQD